MFTDVWGMESGEENYPPPPKNEHKTGTVMVEADREPESPFSSGFTSSMNEPIPVPNELKSDIQKGINTPPKMEPRKEPSVTPADALNVSTGETAGGVNLENCVAKGVISAVKTAARMFLLEDVSLMYQYVFGSSGSMYDFDGRNVSLDEVQSRGALALVLGGYGISSMISRVTAMSTSFGEAGLGNPFKTSTLSEIDINLQHHVISGKLELKYVNAINGGKSYLNKNSGFSYYLDPGGIYGKKIELPHVDVNYPNPKPLNIPSKKKLPVAGGF